MSDTATVTVTLSFRAFHARIASKGVASYATPGSKGIAYFPLHWVKDAEAPSIFTLSATLADGLAPLRLVNTTYPKSDNGAARYSYRREGMGGTLVIQQAQAAPLLTADGLPPASLYTNLPLATATVTATATTAAKVAQHAVEVGTATGTMPTPAEIAHTADTLGAEVAATATATSGKRNRHKATA